MLVRHTLIARNVAARAGQSLTLRVPGPRGQQPEVQVVAQANRLVSIRVTTSASPQEKHLRLFSSLARGIMPAGARPYETLRVVIQPGQELNGHVPALGTFPAPFQSYVDALRRDLLTTAKSTWRLLRWRFNIETGDHGFSSDGTEWSLDDGRTWHRMPARGTARVSTSGGLRVGADVESEIERLATEGVGEPLAHDLLREARDVRHLNGRSALIVAMAALESGVKDYISRRLPDARWLAEELPAPPLESVLRHYVPKLAAPTAAIRAIPEGTLAVIKAAVPKRNRLAHVGVEVVDDDFLEQVLTGVSDCLRVLDALAGHDWALRYLSDKARSELGL